MADFPWIPESVLEGLKRYFSNQLIESGASATLGREFDESRFIEAATKWAEDHVGELMKQLSETDREVLDSAVDAAIREGWSPGKLRDFLSSNLYPPDRISTIARTEPALAQNAGKALRWSAEGIEYFRVLDAPGCLPNGHDDSAGPSSGTPGVVELDREANGQIWTRAQVDQYLLGHPNCERDFVPIVPDSPLLAGVYEGSTDEQ